jgi:riboflavin synthase
MFTGIIEHTGIIESLSLRTDGGRVTIQAPEVAASLAVSNSIAVNGCCLTVVSRDAERFSADLSGETIARTSFGATDGGLKTGAVVNLERPLTAGKEFGGHFVLGHVDGVGHVSHLQPEGDNWWFGAKIPEDFARHIVSKGSITIDGISLTIARWHNLVTPASQSLTVEIAVIPYTYEHTNLRERRPGDAVNLEADILGKYIERHLAAGATAPPSPSSFSITLARLLEEGF